MTFAETWNQLAEEIVTNETERCQERKTEGLLQLCCDLGQGHDGRHFDAAMRRAY